MSRNPIKTELTRKPLAVIVEDVLVAVHAKYITQQRPMGKDKINGIVKGNSLLTNRLALDISREDDDRLKRTFKEYIEFLTNQSTYFALHSPADLLSNVTLYFYDKEDLLNTLRQAVHDLGELSLVYLGHRDEEQCIFDLHQMIYNALASLIVSCDYTVEDLMVELVSDIQSALPN